MRRVWPWTFLALGVVILSFAAWQAGWGPFGPKAPIGELIESPPIPEVLQAISDLIKEKRDYSAAERRARELLPEIDETYGGDSLEAAWVRDLLAEALWRDGKGREPGALQHAERALQLKEENLGAKHVEFAASLRNVGQVFEANAEWDRAAAVYEKVIAIKARAWGAAHLEVAKARIDLAILYEYTDRLAEAREEYERILSIQEEANAEKDAALTLSNLAGVHRKLLEFDEAVSLNERALEIRLRLAEGKDDLDVAWTLNNYAIVLEQIGEYSEAGRRYKRALAIREALLPPGDSRIAWLKNNLANLYRDTGRYSEARFLYEEALASALKKFGPVHSDVARVKHNMAWLFTLTGDYDRAKELYGEAVRVRTALEENVEAAETHENFATLLVRAGEYAEAEAHYGRAMKVLEEARVVEHPGYSRSLRGLALIRAVQGRYDAAATLIERALRVEEKVLGNEHPGLAETLLELAAVRRADDRPSEARSAILRAIRTAEGALGPGHPLAGRGHGDLASVLVEMGEFEMALRSALRAEEVGRNHLLLTARTLPERQALRYADVRSSGLDLALSIAASGGNEVSLEDIWTALIKSRALILEEMAARRHSLAEFSDPEMARLAGQYEASVRRVAERVLAGPGLRNPERYDALLRKAQIERERAERALAVRSAAFREEQARRSLDLTNVRENLPDGVALVAYARYKQYEIPVGENPSGGVWPPDVRSGNSEPTRGPVESYIVFVLEPGATRPSIVPLGLAEEIETLIGGWRQVAATKPQQEEVPPEDVERELRQVGESLRRRVWDPVVPTLDNADLVLVIPDGELNLINFSALPASSGGYLIEHGPTIHYLSAERDVVPTSAGRSVGTGLFAMGAPDYDSPIETTSEGNAANHLPGNEIPGASPRRESRDDRSGYLSLRKTPFTALPNMKLEIEKIADLWQRLGDSWPDETDRRRPEGTHRSPVVQHTGSGACEQVFKAEAPGSRVIHLATHAFFLGDGRRDSSAETRAVGFVGPARKDRTNATRFVDPLFLAGIVLAGANQRRDAWRSGTEEEDGILTAAEVSAMDLGGVDWVVLSACVTGLGRVAAGEGVLGLRRAFEIAGVRSVVMSLWNVDDLATRTWMTQLYEGRLQRGLGTAQAVRETSLLSLKQHREQDGFGHPYYWGAFIAAGEWR